MTFPRPLAIVSAAILAFTTLAEAGNEAVSRRIGGSTEIVAPSFEVAVETSYLWGAIANPNSYELASPFRSARWRWELLNRD